jgi:dihydroorotase/N-acyl-D-amino-acid deacylase
MIGAGMEFILKNVRIVDGTGSPWFRADVAVNGERIEKIAVNLPVLPHQQIIDGEDLVLAPGFIDIMSHSIYPLLKDGTSLSKLAQGVTTEIMGEGWTPAPVGGRFTEPLESTRPEHLAWHDKAKTWTRFSDWLEAMVERGVAVNIGSFLGGGTLRQYVRGMDMGDSSQVELEELKTVMAGAMTDGAFGVSYALIYPPEAFVSTQELIEVCKAVKEHGGLYISHIRNESDTLQEALEEALHIGKEADIPIHIYHLKASGTANWSKIPKVLERINQARASGQDVTADMYPYTAAGGDLAFILPPWVAEGDQFYERILDPEIQKRVRHELEHPSGEWEQYAIAGSENIYPMEFRLSEHQKYINKSLAEIASERGKDWIDTVFDLLIAEQQGIFTYYFDMTEENLERQLREPWLMIASDEGGFDPAWAKGSYYPHPRGYGTFSRVLGHYSRDKKILGLEEAVRKMTSLPAARLGIMDRGLLRPGFYADMVLFDPEMIKDTATFAEPNQLSIGVKRVWVNGTEVFRDGKYTGVFPGRALYGAGKT